MKRPESAKPPTPRHNPGRNALRRRPPLTTAWPTISGLRRMSFGALLFTCLFLTFTPETVLATQGHAGIEGVYVHQLAHIFFAFSMGTFIYWLRKRKLVKNVGWRNLQYAAFFFILWNADAFTVHLLEEQLKVMSVSRSGPLLLDISAQRGFEWLGPVYYAAKLDHLLCVPAMLFFYLGLRKLLSAPDRDRVREEAP